MVKDPSGELIFQGIHWERTRNAGAARVYCGKAEGRLDGPWVFGQNKGGGGGGRGYKLALEAKSSSEAIQAIKENHPRDWFNNGQRIRENVEREYKQPPRVWAPRPLNTFRNVPGELNNWFNTYVRDGSQQLDRYDLLVVVGETKLGKTQFMRALGKHIYWKSMVRAVDLVEIVDYTYIIVDDIEWRFVPESMKKSVLLGSGDCIVSDKYVKKLPVYANRPCVYICNPPDEGFKGFWETDPYWMKNTIVVNIVKELY